MERKGDMSDREMAEIEDMLNTVKDDGDMTNLVILPPPFTEMAHRDKRILCRVGDKTYCPGEVLFRKSS